jgi:hypothetical protein
MNLLIPLYLPGLKTETPSGLEGVLNVI